ncbi:30S ribosomal protein S18 [Anaerofustis stercorihominis]|nr:30S ribosomal protein S18 [Anaerofustis stercorihominis]MCR2032485.1 30S ribosomal protein S18 [Anaerofustis stercorihominis]
MQRQGGSNGGYRGGSNGGFRRRKKVCYFCENKIEHIDYKDTKLLKKYVSERYKILPRRVTGTCAKHQRGVTQAVNIARNAALLPYTTE